MQTPPSEERSQALTQVASGNTGDRVIKFLYRIAADEISKTKRSLPFRFPFYATEEALNRIHADICTSMSDLSTHGDHEFHSETRFQNRETIHLDSYSEFIKTAGHQRDPESAELRWKKFWLSDSGELEAREVRIDLVTEKKFEREESVPGEYHRAAMLLEVAGTDHRWVDQTYIQLVPHLEALKLAGLYRPLWIFRNGWFIAVLSNILGWIGFIGGARAASHYFFGPGEHDRSNQLLQKIVETGTIKDKLDLLSRFLLTPEQSPWWQPIVILWCGAIAYVLTLYRRVSQETAASSSLLGTLS